MNKVYVVEAKTSLADWHPDEVHLSRAAAECSVEKKRQFLKRNKFTSISVRVKVYVPPQRKADRA